jgi:hypothetical protein
MNTAHTSRPKYAPARKAWDYFANRRKDVAIRELYYSRSQDSWVCWYTIGNDNEWYQPEGTAMPSEQSTYAAQFR